MPLSRLRWCSGRWGACSLWSARFSSPTATSKWASEGKDLTSCLCFAAPALRSARNLDSCSASFFAALAERSLLGGYNCRGQGTTYCCLKQKQGSQNCARNQFFPHPQGLTGNTAARTRAMNATMPFQLLRRPNGPSVATKRRALLSNYQ